MAAATRAAMILNALSCKSDERRATLDCRPEPHAMIELLTNADTAETARRSLTELIGAHAEWLCARNSDAGRSISLRKGELDFRVAQGRLIFSFWGEQGAQSWRVKAWVWDGAKISLEATRRMGAERDVLQLIPRASANALAAIVGAARRARCERLAGLACEKLIGGKVERLGLSAGARRGQPGRYARVVLRLRHAERIAVTGTVAEDEAGGVDAFLSSALVWFTNASEKGARPPYIRKLWLIARHECVEQVTHRLALLKESLRRAITLYGTDEELRELTPVRCPELAELWAEKPARLPRPASAEMSESAGRVVALAPDAIDVIRARHGETLRFHGLSFARVRRVMNRERVWFGAESAKRRLLGEEDREDWTKLLRELAEHRSVGAEDRRHALYEAYPEAWLESLLRRDITRLDPGLRIAPLFIQFRASHAGRMGARPVDLLALRRDGRLVVIELKVSEDREFVLQAADYWRRVSAHHRAGHIMQARLFGDAEISDEPPLVYLVAPILRFHRAFHTLARSITPEIELYRFDINEDWRAGVRVMRRTRIS